MGLRLFADHCVSNEIIHALRAVGHEVLRLKDHLPTESPGALVIAKAQELDAILLSLNGDFGHWFSLKWHDHLGHEFARAGCPCYLKLNQYPISATLSLTRPQASKASSPFRSSIIRRPPAL